MEPAHSKDLATMKPVSTTVWIRIAQEVVPVRSCMMAVPGYTTGTSGRFGGGSCQVGITHSLG